MKTVVLSVGGSVIVQDSINVAFLESLVALVRSRSERFIIVVGGGKVCRTYLNAAPQASDEDRDWIGIAATHLNAQLVRSYFGKEAHEAVIVNPTIKVKTSKRILVAGGWKPGHSTDHDAVELAAVYDAKQVINVTNVDYLYNDDPRANPGAQKIEQATWAQLKKLVGEKWKPGLNAPFDPIATQRAAALGLELILVGADVNNLRRFLENKPFKGTRVR